MSVKVINVTQNTPEWHSLRQKYVTGSNADILLQRGVNAAIAANLNSFNGNFYTKRGHILEKEALKIYEQINDVDVLKVGFVVNKKYKNAGCSPDGIAGDTLLEVKCFAEKRHLEIINKASILYKIQAQIQWNMMICELEKAKLILYNPDIEDINKAYVEILLTANKTIQKNLASKL